VTRHCDDYIDDPAAHPALRAFLARARAPAHGLLSDEPQPQLFADHEGKRVRVTMASRLGDVGITSRLDDSWFGYDRRVAVEQLSSFSDKPGTPATAAFAQELLTLWHRAHDVVLPAADFATWSGATKDLLIKLGLEWDHNLDGYTLRRGDQT
jgi:hypothetical protein